MVLGKRKIRPAIVKELTPQEIEEKKRLIKIKIDKLKENTKIPPPIHQFKTSLSEEDTKKALDLFSKYKRESRSEKVERLKKENPREGPKPILVKYGLKHVTNLIEAKQLKLVLIAGDVDPIETVIFLPTLCKKMGVPYAIVPSKAKLGSISGFKSAAVMGLKEVRPEDKATFEELIRVSNSVFAENYSIHMSKWGGACCKVEQ